MTCIITGATKGIGRAIAEIFAQHGFDLVLTARNADLLATLKKEWEARYRVQIFVFAADLRIKAEVQRFADFVLTHCQQVNVLVNNAGIFAQSPLLEAPDDQLEQMLQINLFSAYHLTRALLPNMLKHRKGHIFNICSVASQQAYQHNSSYTISKFALLGFSKSLRLEFRDRGIKVTSVLPGATLTESWEGVNVPPGRLMEPTEIAKAIWSAWDMGPTAVVEEIVLRPQLGDL